LALCLALDIHSAADPQKKEVAPPRPAALAALDRFVGNWKGEVEVQSAEGTKTTYASRNAFAWDLKGVFLKDQGGAVSGESAFLGMWSFDQPTQRYRSWYFSGPGGEAVNCSFVWDEKNQAFKGGADLGGGMVLESEDRFTGRDSYTWSITIKDKGGRQLNRMVGRQTRVP